MREPAHDRDSSPNAVGITPGDGSGTAQSGDTASRLRWQTGAILLPLIDLEEIAHGLGIHRQDLKRALLAALAMASLTTAFILARRGWGREPSRAHIARAVSVLLLGALVSSAILVSGVGDGNELKPVVSQVRLSETFGNLRAVQAVKILRVGVPRQEVTLPRPVDRGDYLLLVFGGLGYSGMAQGVTAVEDNLNGPWKALHRPGGRTPDGLRWVDFAVFRVAPSHAGRMTITIAGFPGQSGATITILDLAGAQPEMAADFADADALEPFPPPGANDPGAAPGDQLLGLFAIYDYGQRLSDQPGWTLDLSARAAGCAATLLLHRAVPATTGAAADPLLRPSPLGPFAMGIIRLRPVAVRASLLSGSSLPALLVRGPGHVARSALGHDDARPGAAHYNRRPPG